MQRLGSIAFHQMFGELGTHHTLSGHHQVSQNMNGIWGARIFEYLSPNKTVVFSTGCHKYGPVIANETKELGCTGWFEEPLDIGGECLIGIVCHLDK